LDADELALRQLNAAVRGALAEGREVVVTNTGARYNLGVALLRPGRVTFDGSVGYYCAGMNDGATVRISGSAGWGVAEGMLSGTVVVEGNAGNGAAAAIRGGTGVVKGDCASRAGVSMKGGLLLIAGDAGYMTGFMMQKGTVAILGNAGEALADSMYEGSFCRRHQIVRNDALIETRPPRTGGCSKPPSPSTACRARPPCRSSRDGSCGTSSGMSSGRGGAVSDGDAPRGRHSRCIRLR
jgi:formylmethanofuran dehydrogenase subunit C